MTKSEEEMAFYYHIGRSLTQWAWVESALFWIFCSALKQVDRIRPHEAAFFGIESFRSKLQAVDRSFKTTFGNTKHIDRWTQLERKAGDLSAVRNNLAHWQVHTYRTRPEGKQWFLAPRYSKPGTRKRNQPPPNAMSVIDIAQAERQFFALYAALANLFVRLDNAPEFFQEHEERAGRPPTLVQIRKDLYGILEPPPKAFRARLGGAWAELDRP